MGQIAQKNDNAPAPTPPVPANKPEPAKPNAAEALPPVPAQNSLADLIANEAKNKPKEKPAEKAAASQPQFDNLLKNLSQLKPSDTNPAANPNAAATGPAAGAPGIVSDKLTISEEDALRRQIEQCWNIPSGAKDAQNMVVEIRVEVNPDKTVRTANILPNPMMGDPFFRAAAESARRAILNPNCSPLNLPEGREESWRVMTLRFNPKDVL
jgi:outer membrane biosynthesis protein TonB